MHPNICVITYILVSWLGVYGAMRDCFLLLLHPVNFKPLIASYKIDYTIVVSDDSSSKSSI